MNMKLRTAIIVAAASPLAAAPAWAKESVVVQAAAFTGAQAQSGKAIRAGTRLYPNHANNAGPLGPARINSGSSGDASKGDEAGRPAKEPSARGWPMAFV